MNLRSDSEGRKRVKSHVPEKRMKKMMHYCDLKSKLGFVQEHKKNSFSNMFTRTSKVYLKILRNVEKEAAKGANSREIFGIGIAIEDGNRTSIFKTSTFRSSKGLDAKEGKMSSEVALVMALVEGLKAATSLGLKEIKVINDTDTVFRLITGKLSSEGGSLAELLIKEAIPLVSKFRSCHAYVINKDTRYSLVAAQLARDAVASKRKELIKTCKICVTDTYIEEMFSLCGCSHSYCRDCNNKHVEVRLRQWTGVPKCPKDRCFSDLRLDSCRKLLTPQVFHLLNERVKEATIPMSQKVYCPYPRCSALMSKSDVQGYDVEGASMCRECCGLFCMSCQVPWHSSMTCSSFKQSNPLQLLNERRFKAIANKESWMQCSVCKHMVSLTSGCDHITCRCGHQFCYSCGADLNKHDRYECVRLKLAQEPTLRSLARLRLLAR